MLQASRGITGKANRGPVPLARGLQALELYFAVVTPGWLPSGWYHCDCVRYFFVAITVPSGGRHSAHRDSFSGTHRGRRSLIYLVVGSAAFSSASWRSNWHYWRAMKYCMRRLAARFLPQRCAKVLTPWAQAARYTTFARDEGRNVPADAPGHALQDRNVLLDVGQPIVRHSAPKRCGETWPQRR